MSADRYAWMDSALCAQADPDQWTAIPGDGRKAKQICGRCPVRDACTAHANAIAALDGTSPRGIWGGHSHQQRRKQRHHDMGEAA